VDARPLHLQATLLPHGDRPVDLWLDGGRISFRARDGAEPLARPGGFVLAGLVDCHAHLTLDPGRKGLPIGSAELVLANGTDWLAAGTLLLRDVGAASDATQRLRLRDDGLFPRLQFAGRFLAPSGGYGGIQRATAADELGAAAAAQAASGVGWVKVIGDWPRGGAPGALPALDAGELNYPAAALSAAVAAAHAAGARVAVHAMTRDAIAAAVEAGVDCIEHATALDEPLLRRMAARGIGWTPTLAAQQATQRSATRRGQEALAAWLADCFEALRTLLPLARALGVPVLAGTDVLPPGSVAREVAALQASGLEPAEALAAASSSARAFLGEPDLQEGAPADLVLYESDPRNDPELLAHPSLIVLGGRVVAHGAG
jgi:imidazolonepropionase-like amidohydrolase